MRQLFKKTILMCLLTLLLLCPSQVQASRSSYVKQQNFLTKTKIRNALADTCSKLMIVAHPDDETFWGGAHLLEKGYFVVCLTNGNSRRRKAEFESLLRATGNKGMILYYPDRVGGKKSNWSKCKGAVSADLGLLVRYKKWKQIVTHSPKGEYGHIQHKLTSKMVTKQCKAAGKYEKLYYFGKYYSKTRLKRHTKKLTRLPKKQLVQKEKLLKYYPSQRNAIKAFSHMNPYETWIPASEWK
ncbi:MAG: PIG-L family deacetylase [Eubacteriales bacterium]|nr:PIG-L family deacetylase [Eubacteriales bacterium]